MPNTPPRPPLTGDLTARRPLPVAAKSIGKGADLSQLLAEAAIDVLSHNVGVVCPDFKPGPFQADALHAVGGLGLMDRGRTLARVLHAHLPGPFDQQMATLLDSVGPPSPAADPGGLAVFFYLPHTLFAAQFGTDPAHNDGRDPYPAAMTALHALTQRFTAEFAIRPFLIAQPARTQAQLMAWTQNPNVHVRRLCSEGSRPRLPWAMRLPHLQADPSPNLPLLEALKDDPELYVRRSVANHVGDIAKDHPVLAFDLCEAWLEGADAQRCWVIRHALRLPAKKGVPRALALRAAARI